MVKLIMKVNIYPSKSDFREATEAYLIETHPKFYEKFIEHTWKSYFNGNLYARVSFVFENVYNF